MVTTLKDCVLCGAKVLAMVDDKEPRCSKHNHLFKGEKMASAIINISQDDDSPEGMLNISIEFDPPVKKDKMNPYCHSAALIALNAIADDLDSDISSRE